VGEKPLPEGKEHECEISCWPWKHCLIPSFRN